MQQPQLQHAQPLSNFSENENEDKGTFLSPPQFKLEASALGEKENTNEEANSLDTGAYVENVANFAKITQKIQNFVPKGYVPGIAETLEELKHDPQEVAHFRKYFAEKVGKSFREYLGEFFNDDAADFYEASLDYTKDTFPASEIAQAFHEYLEEGNSTEIFSLLSITIDVKAISTIYKETYQGKDLYTDLIAASTNENDFTSLANKVFGKVQNNEKVKVKDEKEAQEAREIIARIYEKYGVEVNSQKSLDTVVASVPDAPKELTAQIKTSTWTLEELRALERSLAKFADFLSPRPTSFEEFAPERELETIGKVNQDILLSKTNNPYLSENVGGTSDYENLSITLFDNMNSKGYADRHQSQEKNPENGKIQNQNKSGAEESVMTHELSHSILHKYLSAFMRISKFWISSSEFIETKTIEFQDNNYPIKEFQVALVAGVEAPITSYGCSNAEEDLAEAVTVYLNNPSLLLNGHPSWHKLPNGTRRMGVTGNPCPKRYAFIKKIFDDQSKAKNK